MGLRGAVATQREQMLQGEINSEPTVQYPGRPNLRGLAQRIIMEESRNQQERMSLIDGADGSWHDIGLVLMIPTE